MIEEKKKNLEIVTVFNRYKDTLEDFINNLDLELLPRPINEGLCNALRSRSSSTDFQKMIA